MFDEQTTTLTPDYGGASQIASAPPLHAAAAFPLLADEKQRLRALAAYGLADTAPEADFDHFAAMAADLLDLPVGLVNLVGAEHLTVKGRSGLDVESIPRDAAFCAHTILGDDPLVVPDLARDARFSANPLVTEEGGFRFYAGAPLISPLDGHRIGTLCVVDHVARPGLNARETRLLTGLAALVMDRMELRRAENARRDAQARFERMAAATPGAVVCADRNGTITHWNQAAERLFGWSATEAIGQKLEMIVPEEMRAAHGAGLARLAAAENQAFPGRTVELPALRRDGTVFPAQVTLSCWREDGAPAFGASIHDITIRRRAEDRLRHLAHNDALTGCVNRAKLMELIEAVAAGAEPTAIILLDLDGFKHVNDTLGHAAGDALLVEAVQRLAAALSGQGTLARLGGDEFAVLLPGYGDADAARGVARALQQSFEPPFRVAGREFHVSASAGVAVAAISEIADLLANADLALYQAKAAGDGQCRVFNGAMREEYAARRLLEEQVCRAARNGEFELHYQPQVCLSRNVLVGAEALLRWHHPERGLLPPGVFLDVLDASPMAGVVGDWAIEEGCRQAALWRGRGLNLRVGVNLFAEQLRMGNLEATVKDALARWRLPPAALELELTETIALRHDDGLLAPLHALRERGVGIAFDDFGTGFASLSTLKRCPLSRLKIDRGFISDLGSVGVLGSGPDRGDVAIVEAVLALGRGLGLGVVAEGVETEAQAAFLAARGCSEAQGYLYSRPTPAPLMLTVFPRQHQCLGTGQPTPPSAASVATARAASPSATPARVRARRQNRRHRPSDQLI